MHITAPPYDNISNDSPGDRYTLLCIFPQLTPARGHKNDPNSQFHHCSTPHIGIRANRCCTQILHATRVCYTTGDLTLATISAWESPQIAQLMMRTTTRGRGGGGSILQGRALVLLRGGLTQKERGDKGCRRAGDIERDSGIKIGTPMPNESNDELVL